MKKNTRFAIRLAASVAVCMVSMASITASLAQDLVANSIAEPGDPARWYQEDLTPRARFLTMKKENYAAYKEALSDCKQALPSSRSACVRDARLQLEQDQESARKTLQESIP